MYAIDVNIKSHIYFFIQIYSEIVFLRQCMSVWTMHVENLVFTTNLTKNLLNKSFKLIKGITWWHSNIVLELKKIKLTNTLKNTLQLGDGINGTTKTKQLQNNQTNILSKSNLRYKADEIYGTKGTKQLQNNQTNNLSKSNK